MISTQYAISRDTSKVTINEQYEVAYALSVGSKIEIMVNGSLIL